MVNCVLKVHAESPVSPEEGARTSARAQGRHQESPLKGILKDEQEFSSWRRREGRLWVRGGAEERAAQGSAENWAGSTRFGGWCVRRG